MKSCPQCHLKWESFARGCCQKIESCWSVARNDSFGRPHPVARPAALDYVLSRIRLVASVSTRTTIMLFTPEENRSLA